MELNNNNFIRNLNQRNNRKTKPNDNQRRFHRTAPTAITIQSDINDKFWIGTKIYTKFPQGVFQGEIVRYQRPYYRIKYTDGEEEDLLHHQVQERIRDKKRKCSTLERITINAVWIKSRLTELT